jgi:hypothetical protein
MEQVTRYVDVDLGRRFSTKGLFAHAWDLSDPGADYLTDWMGQVGLDVLCLAGSYHSGWFVHPHSKNHRLFMTEGSVVYFHPQESLYAETSLRPRVASFAEQTNWMTVAAESAQRNSVRLVSWTVGVHNTFLGQRHPECTQQNIYGDSLPHALSIGHDATREYLKALCKDLATNYPLHGIQLEAFGWLSFRHSHHHERDLTGLSTLEQQLLSLCFNSQTVAKAEAVGIDVGKVREVIMSTLEAAFREAPQRPQGHPQSLAELELRSPELQSYVQFLHHLAYSLIIEIKEQSLKGTSCRLYMQEGYRPELNEVVDGFAVWAYGKLPKEVQEIVTTGNHDFPVQWPGEYHCYLRLGMGLPSGEDELREMVLAAKRGGSTGPIFYNYSEAPPRMLGWLSAALAGQ